MKKKNGLLQTFFYDFLNATRKSMIIGEKKREGSQVALFLLCVVSPALR
jgi:hypothetical protein